MRRFFGELLSASRRLSREPATTALAIAVLALGIGLTATLWSLLHGTLGRDLPFEDPDRLVAVADRDPAGNAFGAVTLPDFLAWRDGQSSFEDLAAHQTYFTYVTTDTGTRTWLGAYITASAFLVLGVEPALGRGFTETDDRPGAPPVALISHRLWQRQLAGDSDVLGSTILSNRESATVVGVMPEGFHFPYRHDIWLPFGLAYDAWGPNNQSPWAFAFGRLRAGVSLEAATAELDAVHALRPADSPADERRSRISVEPYVESVTDEGMSFTVRGLFAAVVGVLLIACANVANLLLARSVRRQREVGVRAALGAGRARLAAEALAETLVLALAGGVAGLVLAQAGVGALRRYLAETQNLGYWTDVRLDATSLGVTVAAVTVACLAAGLMPAWRAASTDPRAGLSSTGRGATDGRRVRRVTASLVVIQVALSCALLVGSAAIGGAVLELAGATELARGDVLTAQLSIWQSRWEERERRQGFYRDLEHRVAALPGALSVAFGTSLPYSRGWTTPVSVDHLAPTPEEADTVRWVVVTPSYFETFRIALVAGRGLHAEDSGTVVNRSFVERHLPGREPIGQRIFLGSGEQARETTIVGVVDDVAAHPLEEGDPSAVYTPLDRRPAQSVKLAVRTAGDPLTLTETIRGEIAALSHEAAFYEVRTFKAEIDRNSWPQRTVGGLLTGFGVAALLLAAVGLFGVLSFSVHQRTHEYGVRSALGATPAALYARVMRGGLVQVGLGLVAGFALAAAVSKMIVSRFPEADPGSLSVYVAVGAVLVLSGFAASWWPAQRAGRIDPIEALRQD